MKVRQLEGARTLSLPRTPVSRLVGHDKHAPISVVHFTGDGKYCLTGAHDRTVRLWNPSRLDPAYPPPKQHNSAVGNDMAPSDLPQSLCLLSYDEGITHEVSALAVDDECKTLVTACHNAMVLHDVVTGQCLRRLPSNQHHTGRINAVAVGPQADTFLSASYDATVKIWDARNTRSYEPIQSLNEAKDSVSDVHVDCVSPHLIRTSSVDGTVRTYDLRMGVLTCDNVHVSLTGMAQASDGQCLAVHGLEDATIRLLDTSASGGTSASSLLLNTFVGHHVAGKYALNVSFTTDGIALVTGSEDGTAVVYHSVTAKPLAVLEGHGPQPVAVATSTTTMAERERSVVIVTAGYDGNAVVWADGESYMKWHDD